MEQARDKLIDSLKNKSFNKEIISAFKTIKRENFVPEHLKPYSYEDMSLPIESGSTISKPQTIAFMLSLLDLKPNHKVLEIGSGTGYVLSLISNIIGEGNVYGLEINRRLAIKSRNNLEGDSNITIFNKSGTIGLPNKAPFDRIIVSASFPDLIIPLQLTEQLSDSGIIVSPVQSSIYKLEKFSDKITKEEHPGFTFVPIRDEE